MSLMELKSRIEDVLENPKHYSVRFFNLDFIKKIFSYFESLENKEEQQPISEEMEERFFYVSDCLASLLFEKEKDEVFLKFIKDFVILVQNWIENSEGENKEKFSERIEFLVNISNQSFSMTDIVKIQELICSEYKKNSKRSIPSNELSEHYIDSFK
jgi:hypothetical protein